MNFGNVVLCSKHVWQEKKYVGQIICYLATSPELLWLVKPSFHLSTVEPAPKSAWVLRSLIFSRRWIRFVEPNKIHSRVTSGNIVGKELDT